MTLGLTTPDTQPPPGITRTRFSPIRFRSPLLTESLLFSLPTGTEMFHFPAFPLTTYTFSGKSHTTTACGDSPFGHPSHNTWLSAPPGLSQIPTSFIGSYCQGIHHAPFNTYTHKCKPPKTQNTINTLHKQKRRCSRPLCSSQPPTPTTITTTPKEPQQPEAGKHPEQHVPSAQNRSPENPTAHHNTNPTTHRPQRKHHVR